MPESIRNAIMVAFIAVLVATVGVGLLLWRGRPAVPAARPEQGLPLLVTDRYGGIYDLNVKVQQIERRLAEGQMIDQQLLEALKSSNEDRAQLSERLTALAKEVRSLRKRVLVVEQRQTVKQPPAEQPRQAAPATTSTSPATTTAPTGELPPAAAPP